MTRHNRGHDAYMVPTKPWTQDEIRHLRKLWDDGGVSIKDMQKTLGRTKGSVIGKAHKMEFPARPKSVAMHTTLSRTAVPPPDLSAPPPVLDILPSLLEPLPDEPLDLDYQGLMPPMVRTEPMYHRSRDRIRTCMYTSGERGNWTFCEAQATKGVWCDEHHQLSIAHKKDDEI